MLLCFFFFGGEVSKLARNEKRKKTQQIWKWAAAKCWEENGNKTSQTNRKLEQFSHRKWTFQHVESANTKPNVRVRRVTQAERVHLKSTTAERFPINLHHYDGLSFCLWMKMALDEEAYGVDDVMSFEFTSKMVKSSVKTENNFTFGFYTYHHRHRKNNTQPATWAMWFRPRELSMGEILKVSLFFVAFSENQEEKKKISTISIPPRAAIFCCLLCHPSSGCRCHPMCALRRE